MRCNNIYSLKVSVFAILSVFIFNHSVKSQDSNFYIFLCFGQSNMQGAAPFEAEDTIGNNRFLLFQALDCQDINRKKAYWYEAIPPTCQCNSGLSPADYFGRKLVENLPDSIRVGIINVSVAGCDIRLFDKDLYKDYSATFNEDWFASLVASYEGNPYQYLVELAKMAQKDGVVKGILLHQGETNNGDEQWPFYVKKIYKDILIDLSLSAESVPLLAGELLSTEENCCASMNNIIRKLPEIVFNSHIISSKACTGFDSAHFDAKGYRELGKRYGEVMFTLLQLRKDMN